MLSIDDLVNVIKQLKGDRDLDEKDMKEAAIKVRKLFSLCDSLLLFILLVNLLNLKFTRLIIH